MTPSQLIAEVEYALAWVAKTEDVPGSKQFTRTDLSQWADIQTQKLAKARRGLQHSCSVCGHEGPRKNSRGTWICSSREVNNA